MIHTFEKIKNFFIKPRLSPEAFEAYFHRLPESVHVDWKRDGDMIIGKVVSDGKEFSTQGRNPEEFIEMVNDALYTVYDIPFDYIDAISASKAFFPKGAALQDLFNGNVSQSSLLLPKTKVQLA